MAVLKNCSVSGMVEVTASVDFVIKPFTKRHNGPRRTRQSHTLFLQIVAVTDSVRSRDGCPGEVETVAQKKDFSSVLVSLLWRGMSPDRIFFLSLYGSMIYTIFTPAEAVMTKCVTVRVKKLVT